VQTSADPVQPAVLLGAVVDHEDHDVHPTVVAQIGDGDIGALVGPGKPARYVNPRCPPAGDAVAGQPVPEPE
jgi:hypothetical protein